MTWFGSRRLAHVPATSTHTTLLESKAHAARWLREPPRLGRPRSRRQWCLFLAVFFLLSACVLFLLSHRFDSFDYTLSFREKVTLDASKIVPGDRKLIIILPVDSPSPDLCKVVASAVALGYPAPVLVNWKKDFHTEERGVGPSHLGKVTGTLDYLDWATGEDVEEEHQLDDDDIVLMLDAHDVWLQLPPEILLHRYFEAIQHADRRLKHEGFANADAVRTTVIASAQKGCFAPRDPISNLHCSELPPSTLSSSIYGLFTDSKIFGWNYLRPRYVNSGSFMGPAGDMKRYFRRVGDTMRRHMAALDDGEELAGDQGVFSEVFGEQEVWRKRVLKGVVADKEGEDPLAAAQTYEYHVGLDYTQALFYPTCYSETDGAFVALGDTDALQQRSSEAGVSPPRVAGVPNSILDTESPLAPLEDVSSEDRSWGKLPLYTDFWTTSIPVAVHHNAWKNDLKRRRTTWWDRTWYFPHLRRLIAAHSSPVSDLAPLTTLQADNGTLQIWASDAHSGKRKTLLFGKPKDSERWTLKEADWATVCDGESKWVTVESRQWYDEVLRDGKGPL